MKDPKTGRDAGGLRLKAKQYEKELRTLQVELCRLREWVKVTGQKVEKVPAR